MKAILPSRERARRIAFVLWVTLGLNLVVALLKIYFGWVSHTMVILADGFHSLSDGTSNVVGLIGIHLAGHPADDDHPYGHHKFETMASIIIGALLLFVAFGVGQKAVEGFFHPRDPEISPVSFLVMAGTLAVNLLVVWYERRAGKKYHSEFLISDSWHTLTDVFITLGVFVTLIGIALNFRMLDSIVSLGIAGAIAWVGVEIVRQSTDVLTDKAVMDPEVIDRVVRSVDGVRDCHEIRTRGKAHMIYVDMHVLVDPRMSVEDSHRLSNRIEAVIMREVPGICDVVVHIEPTTHDHSELEHKH